MVSSADKELTNPNKRAVAAPNVWVRWNDVENATFKIVVTQKTKQVAEKRGLSVEEYLKSQAQKHFEGCEIVSVSLNRDTQSTEQIDARLPDSYVQLFKKAVDASELSESALAARLIGDFLRNEHSQASDLPVFKVPKGGRPRAGAKKTDAAAADPLRHVKLRLFPKEIKALGELADSVERHRKDVAGAIIMQHFKTEPTI